MGFIKRLLGLEVKPGEPQPLRDNAFEREVLLSELPCFVSFYSLWCASCQVMGGLLNEVGPEFAGRAEFYKINIRENPSAPSRYGVSGVPAVVLFKNGEPVDRLVGLVTIDTLRMWLESHI